MSEHGMHMSHCNIGDYRGSCKYGDDDCPAMVQARMQPKSAIRLKLGDFDDDVLLLAFDEFRHH
jgi:hypothetical protein